MRKQHLLVDMDNTIYDFHKRIEECFIDNYKNKLLFANELTVLPRSQWNKFQFRELFTENESLWGELWEFTRSLYQNLDFFANLELIKWAKDAIFALLESNDITICTTASELNIWSEMGKRFALERDFNYDMARGAVFAVDKTQIVWDKLIDDKPTIGEGKYKPVREHILYDQPYNRDIIWKRINDRSNIEIIL